MASKFADVVLFLPDFVRVLGGIWYKVRKVFPEFVYFCPCLFTFLVILGTNTGKSLAIDVIIFAIIF